MLQNDASSVLLATQSEDADVDKCNPWDNENQGPVSDSPPLPDHMLLVLSDSALPLGSFAFSSGLESFIAHRKPRKTESAEVQNFLALSIASVAGATLPFVLAAFRHPEDVLSLDHELDASTLCHVARRASVAQGRALLGVWERSLRRSVGGHASNKGQQAQQALDSFNAALRGSSQNTNAVKRPSGHLAPLWGAICAVTSIPEPSATYIYLFKHAQSVLSAAVRASTMGPYQAQSILASPWLRTQIHEALRENWNVAVEDAGQVVPMMDFWVALHDKLYTKIFNS